MLVWSGHHSAKVGPIAQHSPTKHKYPSYTCLLYCMVVSSSMGTRSMRNVVSAKESVRARYLPEDLSPVYLVLGCGGSIVV